MPDTLYRKPYLLYASLMVSCLALLLNLIGFFTGYWYYGVFPQQHTHAQFNMGLFQSTVAGRVVTTEKLFDIFEIGDQHAFVDRTIEMNAVGIFFLSASIILTGLLIKTRSFYLYLVASATLMLDMVLAIAGNVNFYVDLNSSQLEVPTAKIGYSLVLTIVSGLLVMVSIFIQRISYGKGEVNGRTSTMIA